jgi:hypothetical protein
MKYRYSADIEVIKYFSDPRFPPSDKYKSTRFYHPECIGTIDDLLQLIVSTLKDDNAFDEKLYAIHINSVRREPVPEILSTTPEEVILKSIQRTNDKLELGIKALTDSMNEEGYTAVSIFIVPEPKSDFSWAHVTFQKS